MNSARPNTLLPVGMLRADMVLCCGEDLEEFKRAVTSVFSRPRRVHRYRCYEFMEAGGVSFVWTGIGSGCLEPLICEIVSEPRLRRIILVGTAGAISKRTKLGFAGPITQARIACAGVVSKRSVLTPNWPIKTTPRSIVSTDYYYGFTLKKSATTQKLWDADVRLAKSVPKALAVSDLIDMETGQFYHLCRALRPDLHYLAIKGAANPLTNFSAQPLYSQSVLLDAIAKAKTLLSAKNGSN